MTTTPKKKIKASVFDESLKRTFEEVTFTHPSNPTTIEELDSNEFGTVIQNVCSDCGIEANRLTCLKKFGKEPKKSAFTVSTFHKGICDYCKKEKPITQTRDFFFPDFSLLENTK